MTLAVSAESKLLWGVRAKLQADADLAAEIKVWRFIRSRALVRSDSLAPRSLYLSLDASLQERAGSNRQARLETFLYLGLITDVCDRSTADPEPSFLELDLASQIRSVLEQNHGVVQYAGEPVTHAVITFQRSPAPIPIQQNSLLLSEIVVSFDTTVRATTRAIL